MKKHLIYLLVLMASALCHTAGAETLSDLDGLQSSELAQVLSAASREFAAQGDAYAKLYEKYLGVRRDAPDSKLPSEWIPSEEITPGSTLDVVLKRGTVRFGFWRHEPYYYTDIDGNDTGFEFELGKILVERISRQYPDADLKLEWVEREAELPGGGADNIILFEQLLSGLQEGDYDVAFSGLIVKPDRPVATAWPTMDFFFSAIYTGRGDMDLMSVQSTTRRQFLSFLIANPGLDFVTTIGGPSEDVAAELVADVVAAGGVASHHSVTIPELVEELQEQAVHFSIGDAIALSGFSTRPGFPGLNLNLSLRDTTEFIAPVTALDPTE